MPEAPFTPAQLALEQQGLEFLENGKFRKARDAFKILNKSQPSRALPLLIEANLGLAGELMSKGLVSEANQVLAYLKTIAPASYNITLTPATGAAVRDPWIARVPLAAQRLGFSGEPNARILAADQMILGAESPDHPGHPDAKAILTALELGYGSAITARTTELLRSVPRSSPFSHWVLFFKGMTALETGDRARAADCFRRVPECSLLHSAIPALLTLCGAPGTAPPTPPTPRTVHALCAWAGHPALADPLLQVEPLWRKQRRSQAFTLLAKQIPKLFRWGARSFKADLTRFLTNEFIETHLDDSDYCDTLLDYTSVASRTAARAALDQAFFAIDFADYSSCAHRHFNVALAKLETMHRAAPISPAMRSRIFTHLAKAYIADVEKNPYNQCSGPNAKKALEHAIKEDPDNLAAWLMLCDLLAMGKDLPAYHRFLDDLTKRFPAHKEVLIRNGDCCCGRKVYTKALRNFERAAKLDSVDPRITSGILRALLGSAEEAYKKCQPAKVNWDLVESLASTNKSCREYALWRLRVRRIVLEARLGMQAPDLVKLIAATLPHAPNGFLLEAACRFQILKSGQRFKVETLEQIFPSCPHPESLADFLTVIDELEPFANSSHHLSASRLARELFILHQQRLVSFVAERKDLTTFLTKILESTKPVVELASAVIEAWFHRDPSDPLLRFFCTNYHFPWLQQPLADDLSDLAAQLRDSHDPDVHRIIHLLTKDAHRSAAAKHGSDSHEQTPKLDLDYDPHDDDDYDDDEDYDDYDGDLGEDFAAIDEAIGKMSPTAIVDIIKKLVGGAGFPGTGGFTNPVPYNPPPPKPARKPPQKRPGPDRNQLSFDAEITPPPAPPRP